MSDKINDGGSAFPIPNDDRPGAYPAEPGMSLRDWFAGQALAGICSHDSATEYEASVLADAAYEAADAMLASRKGGAT